MQAVSTASDVLANRPPANSIRLSSSLHSAEDNLSTQPSFGSCDLTTQQPRTGGVVVVVVVVEPCGHSDGIFEQRAPK